MSFRRPVLVAHHHSQGHSRDRQQHLKYVLRGIYSTGHTCIIIMSACAESLYPPKLHHVTIHIFKAKEARDSIWHIFFSLYQHLLECGVVTRHPGIFLMYWFMYGYSFCNSKYTVVTYRRPTCTVMGASARLC